MIRRSCAVAALVTTSWAVPGSLAAANKDIERLQLQIAALQSQLLEAQRTDDESRKELRRLADLVAEQNALLGRQATDRRQQDEATAAAFKDLGERVAELGETIHAMKASALSLAPAGGGGSSAPSGIGGTGNPSSPVGAVPQPLPAGPPPAPRELYSQAYADYARGNYDLAIQGFSEYIRNYPGTDFTDNAQYWIGECLYGKKQYAEAIDALNALLKDYPSSDKLPDARVKKGMALEKLGRRSQALLEYRYVIDHYPNTSAAGSAREKLKP